MDDYKVSLGALLDANAKGDIDKQLNAIKDLSVTISRATLSNDAINDIKRQLTQNGIDLKLVFGNTNQIVNQAKQTGQQIGRQIQSGINDAIQKGNFKQEFLFSGNGNNVAKDAQKYFSGISDGIVSVQERMQELEGKSSLQGFVVNIKNAKGEVESLRYSLRNIVDDKTGLVTGQMFKYTGGSINDDSVIKQMNTISTKADSLSTKLEKIKANYSDINATRPIKDSGNISALSQQYDKVTQAIENVRNADNATFSSMVSNAQREITTLETMVSQFRNAENVATQMKSVDISSGIAQAQERLGKLKANASGFEQMTDTIKNLGVAIANVGDKASLDAFINDLRTAETQLGRVKAEVKQLENVNKIQLSTDITKIENDYKRFGIVSQEVENNLKELKIARENALKAEGTDRASAEIEKYNQKLAETKSSWKELQATQVSANQRTTQMTTMQEWMRKNKNATKLCGDEVERLIQECQTCDKVRFDQIKNRFKELQVEAGKAGKLGNSFFGGLIDQGKKFVQWTGVTSIVMGVSNSIRKLISTSKELDKVMTDFTMATGSTESQLKSLTKTYNKLADELSSTTSDVMTSATEWIKQGQSIADTETLITNAMILSKIGNLDSANATKYLTSAMKGYKVSVEDTLGVVDKLSAVDMASATDVGGLAEGMSEVAASADLAGVSMDKLLGYLAAIGETTQSGMSEVGTTLNAVFSRMGNIKLSRLKDYDNNGEDLSNVETVLRGVGISLRDSANSFRDFDEVLDGTASNWSNYSEVQQRAIASAFAGTHHMNEFIVLMENYDKALKYTEKSLNSSGEAMEKFSAYEESVEAHTQSFTNAIQGLADTAVDSGLINFFIDLGTIGIKALDGLMEAITPLGTLALGGGLFAGIKNVGQAKMWAC